MDVEVKGLVKRLQEPAYWQKGSADGAAPTKTLDPYHAAATITRLTTERDEARAEVERLRPAWQLISEVPPPHNEVVLLFWRDCSGAECVEAARYSIGQRLPNGRSNYFEHSWATHWMPVPSISAIRNLEPEVNDGRS